MMSVPPLPASLPIASITVEGVGQALRAASSRPAAVVAADVQPRGLTAREALDQALTMAAEARFPDKSVEVASFHHEASGRDVCRVIDRDTGVVLAQTPPDALLRFYASARAASGPLVEVDV